MPLSIDPLSCDVHRDATPSKDGVMRRSTQVDAGAAAARKSLRIIIFINACRHRWIFRLPTTNQEVAGSSPAGRTIPLRVMVTPRNPQFTPRLAAARRERGRVLQGAPTTCWSIPVTWVTVHSEHIGNTFGPNGFSIGSSLQVSSSK